jgi:hypothetical protein
VERSTGVLHETGRANHSTTVLELLIKHTGGLELSFILVDKAAFGGIDWLDYCTLGKFYEFTKNFANFA